ncbi:MAG TPA: 30S ribosome-binding factor RbfA [Acidimicrobiales bacterium]|nr:30S ribosome-binding factor RbfA [Acidimicrobiales bacterium]
MRGRRGAQATPSRYPRTARVNQVLREVVADALERVADIDDRLRLVTVTAVDTSPDLRHAVVYLSSLSDLMAEALADQRTQLQQAIGRQVRLKRTPQLTFAVDPGVAHGSRVEEILRHLRADEGPAGADGP